MAEITGGGGLMSNSAEIMITGGGKSLFLYTHWGGIKHCLGVVESALNSYEGRARRKDAPYLARIIFERFVEGAEDKETGFGIWPGTIDSYAPRLIVDVDKQEVSFGNLTTGFDCDWSTSVAVLRDMYAECASSTDPHDLAEADAVAREIEMLEGGLD